MQQSKQASKSQSTARSADSGWLVNSMLAVDERYSEGATPCVPGSPSTQTAFTRSCWDLGLNGSASDERSLIDVFKWSEGSPPVCFYEALLMSKKSIA